VTDDDQGWQPARFPTVAEYLRRHPNITEADLQPWRRGASGLTVRVRPLPPGRIRAFAALHRLAGGCGAAVFLQVHPEDAAGIMAGFPEAARAESCAICEHDALTD
jgi:hypothetical protein